MSKLYFYYSAMNAGKTTALLQSSYNYRERGMHTLLYTAGLDFQENENVNIQSRIGLTAIAKICFNKTHLFEQINVLHHQQMIHCVLIDECHFLTKQQVLDLTKVVDILNIPVLCYGLRTDFQAKLFSGSLWLLAWADKLIELKTICYCGNQANRVLRIDKSGFIVKDGNQKMIENDHYYISVCRKHFTEQLQSKLSLFNIKNRFIPIKN